MNRKEKTSIRRRAAVAFRYAFIAILLQFASAAAQQPTDGPTPALVLGEKRWGIESGRRFEWACPTTPGKSHVVQLIERQRRRYESGLFSFEYDAALKGVVTNFKKGHCVTLTAADGVELMINDGPLLDFRKVMSMFRSGLAAANRKKEMNATVTDIKAQMIGGQKAEGFDATVESEKVPEIVAMRLIALGDRGIRIDWHGPVSQKAAIEKLSDAILSCLRLADPKAAAALPTPGPDGKIVRTYNVFFDDFTLLLNAETTTFVRCRHAVGAKHEILVTDVVPVVNEAEAWLSPECSFEHRESMIVTRTPADDETTITANFGATFNDNVRIDITRWNVTVDDDYLASVVEGELKDLVDRGRNHTAPAPDEKNWGRSTIRGSLIRYGSKAMTRRIWLGVKNVGTHGYLLRIDVPDATDPNVLGRVLSTFRLPNDPGFAAPEMPAAPPTSAPTSRPGR